jgi:hypothetical protein
MTAMLDADTALHRFTSVPLSAVASRQSSLCDTAQLPSHNVNQIYGVFFSGVVRRPATSVHGPFGCPDAASGTVSRWRHCCIQPLRRLRCWRKLIVVPRSGTRCCTWRRPTERDVTAQVGRMLAAIWTRSINQRGTEMRRPWAAVPSVICAGPRTLLHRSIVPRTPRFANQ